MTIDEKAVRQFFDGYRDALLARDADAVAHRYAVPSLILFPETSVVVAAEAQTAEFFAGSWDQYEGVHKAAYELSIVLQGPASTWVDVTWRYDGQPRERFCYQLLPGENGPQIAVLTPLGLHAD